MICDTDFIRENILRERRQRAFADAYRLQSCRFEADNGAVPKLEQLRTYARNWDTVRQENIGLLLWGPPGSGKTFAAACTANYLMESHWPGDCDVRMATFGTILTNLLAASPQEKARYVSCLINCDLLILDDLGMERQTEYAREQIFNVVDGRYLANLPLIVTTNLTLQELKNPSSLPEKRIYDRILEMCVPVCFDGESLRREKAAQKLKLFRELAR